MWTTPGAEPVGEAFEVGLVDGIQYLGCCPLDEFVLQHGDSDGPLPSIRFRYVNPSYRPRAVRSATESLGEVLEIPLQVFSVVTPRLAVDPRRGFPFHAQICLAETVNGVYVVPERRELYPPISTR